MSTETTYIKINHESEYLTISKVYIGMPTITYEYITSENSSNNSICMKKSVSIDEIFFSLYTTYLLVRISVKKKVLEINFVHQYLRRRQARPYFFPFSM